MLSVMKDESFLAVILYVSSVFVYRARPNKFDQLHQQIVALWRLLGAFYGRTAIFQTICSPIIKFSQQVQELTGFELTGQKIVMQHMQFLKIDITFSGFT